MSAPETPPYFPKRIVSGGQTGVDRAGLELAIALGIEHGGWCPQGRLAEDGCIPSRYELVEMESPEYPPRTEQNVIDSDATLILFQAKLSGGTKLTHKLAKRWDKPSLCVNLETAYPSDIRMWLDSLRPGVLNVAGPRESTSPGIEQRAFEFLLEAMATNA